MTVAPRGPALALAALPFLAGAPAGASERFAAHARWMDFAPDKVVVDFRDGRENSDRSLSGFSA
ncbi:MAG TPA: hypothetical protein VGC15_25025 [Acetobacteraceae bacterium]